MFLACTERSAFTVKTALSAASSCPGGDAAAFACFLLSLNIGKTPDFWNRDDSNFSFSLKAGLVSFGLWLMGSIWQNQLRTGIRKYGMPVLRLLILRWSSIICLTYGYSVVVYVSARFLPLISWCNKRDYCNICNCGTRMFPLRLPGKLWFEWLCWVRLKIGDNWHFGIPGTICLIGVEK